jgi:hypothetical protein
MGEADDVGNSPSQRSARVDAHTRQLSEREHE